jgi:hypothetical protein
MIFEFIRCGDIVIMDNLPVHKGAAAHEAMETEREPPRHPGLIS